MTYDTYRMIFYVGMGLAGVGFLLTIILFFVLNIPAVIGELTGHTERKAIENIRNRNADGPKIAALELGKSRKLGNSSRKLGKTQKTQKTDKLESITKQLATENAATSPEQMEDGGKTAVLAAEKDYGETTVLTQENGVFEIECDITFIHTEEVIA